jgi:ParD-like antitoxin of type II bacterial toxin-antitoxin system
MGKNVKLSDSLVERAVTIFEREHRTVPMQIEFYFNIAAIAEETPDLSFKLIKEILKADAEKATVEYDFSK